MVLSITIIIIIATVGVSFYAWNNDFLLSKWMMNPYRVWNRREYWRTITSGFIHSGYVHLGFNMFTFYFFGGVVEQIFQMIHGASTGSFLFVGFYISAIVVSDLPTLFTHRNNPGYNSLGASGGVSAMVFSSILFMPLNKICLFAILCLPGFILGIIYLIYSYTQGKNMSDNINHQAHLTGALYGIIFSLIVYPQAGASFIDQVLNYRLF